MKTVVNCKLLVLSISGVTSGGSKETKSRFDQSNIGGFYPDSIFNI